MKEIICTTQKEYDKAVKDSDALIILKDTKERIVVTVSVEARGNSRVEAWDNSRVVAWDNSRVVAWDNSSVVAWGNSRVEAWDNSSAELRENSSGTVIDNAHILVIGELDGREFKVAGNGSIKKWKQPSYTKHTLKMLAENSGEDFILYKSVNPETDCDFHSGKIKYKIGEEIICPDWKATRNIQCGNGLHLCPTAAGTQVYNVGKILKCLVNPKDISVYPKDISKVRCRAVRPVAVVNVRGEEITEVAL